MTLNCEVDIPKEAKFYERGATRVDSLREFYHQMDFRSLLSELQELSPATGPTPAQVQAQVAQAAVNYHLVDSSEALQALITKLSGHRSICVDTETTGEDPMQLQQIGDLLGLTRERVRQIERDALSYLRSLVEGEAN